MRSQECSFLTTYHTLCPAFRQCSFLLGTMWDLLFHAVVCRIGRQSWAHNFRTIYVVQPAGNTLWGCVYFTCRHVRDLALKFETWWYKTDCNFVSVAKTSPLYDLSQASAGTAEGFLHSWQQAMPQPLVVLNLSADDILAQNYRCLSSCLLLERNSSTWHAVGHGKGVLIEIVSIAEVSLPDFFPYLMWRK